MASSKRCQIDYKIEFIFIEYGSPMNPKDCFSRGRINLTTLQTKRINETTYMLKI